MSAKNMDNQGRWRNKTVAFRVSPEEDELIETLVRLSGLTKQEYIVRRLLEKEIVVVGNPRVYKALKMELAKVLEELQRIKGGEEVPKDLSDRKGGLCASMTRFSLRSATAPARLSGISGLNLGSSVPSSSSALRRKRGI